MARSGAYRITQLRCVAALSDLFAELAGNAQTAIADAGDPYPE